MFGLGASELVVIAILALLIVGPDGLPNAAKSIGKGIRDLRKQKEDLQNTIEKDTQIGEAVKELRSAMRGDPLPPSKMPAYDEESESIQDIIEKSLHEVEASKMHSEQENDDLTAEDSVAVVSEDNAVSRES